MKTPKRKTATLPAEYVSNGHNYGGEKELTSTWDLVAYKCGEFHHVMTTRTYMGRSPSAGRVYCSVWLQGSSAFPGCAGHDYAGGYGYHKASAAMEGALRSAGVKLNFSISGVGESAMRDAMEAVARACGYRKFTILSN